MITYLPLIICLVGGLIYLILQIENPKGAIIELCKWMFIVGLFVTLMKVF